MVYGGSASGVITAVTAAREGARVALLASGKHLGGMVSGGLGATDYGKKEVVGGTSLEFFERVGRHYGERISWYFEPHVAEEVFKEMIREAGVIVLYGRLRERGGVDRIGTDISRIFLEDGSALQGKIFADCSYEGDLMAQAGVSYTWGREGIEITMNRLQVSGPKTKGHMFEVRVSAYDGNRLCRKSVPSPEENWARPTGKSRLTTFGSVSPATRRIRYHFLNLPDTSQRDLRSFPASFKLWLKETVTRRA